MKKRWIIAVVSFVILSGFVVPQLACDIHFFYMQAYEDFTFNPLEGWYYMFQDERPLKLYLLLVGGVLLMLFWILSSTYLNYRSDMHWVTPDICTPCADGQGQFGTARWMNPNQISKHFGVWRIDRKSAQLQQLLKDGQKDQEEIRNANVPLD